MMRSETEERCRCNTFDFGGEVQEQHLLFMPREQRRGAGAAPPIPAGHGRSKGGAVSLRKLSDPHSRILTSRANVMTHDIGRP